MATFQTLDKKIYAVPYYKKNLLRKAMLLCTAVYLQYLLTIVEHRK